MAGNKGVIAAIVALLAVNGTMGYLVYSKIKEDGTLVGRQKVAEGAKSAVHDRTAKTTALPELTATPQSIPASENTEAETAEQAVGTDTKDIKAIFNGKAYKYVGDTLNGKANGTGTVFFDNGDVYHEGLFQNGTALRIGKTYFENGKLREDSTLKDGIISSIAYQEDGITYSRSTYKENSSSGTGEI